MTWRDVRPVALGAVRRGEDLLVFEGHDPGTEEPFYRLVGGAVEFGEHSRDAVVREFDEELGVELADVAEVGTFDRVFTFDGETAHEIWRVYEGDIVEDWPYETEEFTGYEPELDEEFRVCWKHPSAFTGGDEVFYADAVLEALGLGAV